MGQASALAKPPESLLAQASSAVRFAVQFEANGPQAERFELQLDPEPIENRIARQMLTIYAAADDSAPIRGRIPMGRAFEVFARVQGPDCETQWADIGYGGFICLDRTRPAGDRQPRLEPKMRGYGGLTPYFYAKIEKGKPAPRFRSLSDLDTGAEPVDHLAAGTDYAFIARKRHRGQIVLIDDRGRVVREQDVRKFRPSHFEGHDLEQSPLDDGRTIGWVVRWPAATTYAAPDTEAEATGEIDHHTKLDLDAEPVRTEGGDWYHLADGSWLPGKDVRAFVPATDRPDGILADEVWLDVDLDQQTMTAYQGSTPTFVTLVSSGYKAPTPRGIFRIHNKQAVGRMSSSPGDAAFYDVQAVPFIQYFTGGFAIHGAYWHDYFGRPISHGCVNLSPRDARRIFELTTPSTAEGWVHAYEVEGHLGTAVRIRNGDETVTDKRGPVEPVFGI